MGANCEKRGGLSPRLKTLSVALSIALAGSLAAGVGTDAAAAGSGHHGAYGAHVNKSSKKASKLTHRQTIYGDHIDAQRVQTLMHASASRTPRLEASRAGNIVHVTQLADGGAGSLRDALANAHDGDVVDLSRLKGRITLTNALTPASSVIIQGPGRDKLTLDGGGLDRVINSGHDLKISGVTIANGAVHGKKAMGGCLNVSGYLALAYTTISNCSTGDAYSQYSYGGGVYVNGTLYTYYAELSNNSVTGYQIAAGGGAFVRNASNPDGVYMVNSTVSGNKATLDSSINQPQPNASSKVYTYAFGAGVASSNPPAAATVRNIVKYSTFSGNTISAPVAAQYAPNGGGAGAALFGQQQAYIFGSSFSGNTANAAGYAYGGGLATSDTVALVGSQVTGNTASSAYFGVYGGGNINFGPTGLFASTVSGNTATTGCYFCYAKGGGTFALYGFAKYSEISNNTAQTTYGYAVAAGGGLFTGSQGQIFESTISGNKASAYYTKNSVGGGLYSIGAAQVENSTIAFNTTSGFGGGGIAFYAGTAATPSLSLYSTIVSNNVSTFDPTANDIFAFAPITVTGSNNIVVTSSSNVTEPGDTITDDPLLLPLARNGGPTRTHAIDPNSPARDAGIVLSNPTPDSFDQRGPGFSRIIGPNPDIGAYELDTDRIFTDRFELF